MTVKISDVLTEEVVRDRMEDIVQEDLQFRQVYRTLDASDANSGSVKIPRPKDDIGQPESIGQGEEFPRDEENYEKISVDWTKYGFETALTKEAREESMLDVKADQMERQARQLREKLNNLAWSALDNAITTAHNLSNPGGNTSGVLDFDDLIEGRDELRQDNYNPDMLILDVEAETDLLQSSEFKHATDLGDKTLTEGEIGRVAGMDIVLTDAGHISGDGTPTAYIVDTDMFGYEVVREEINTNQYEDPERQAEVMQIWTQRDYHATDATAAVRVDG